MHNRLTFSLLLMILSGFFFQNGDVKAQTPPGLKGQIITNKKSIDIPEKAEGFVPAMRKQDKNKFKRNENGKWEIYFVAFFNKPTPTEKIGIVVLDGKNEPVAVADVSAAKGQTTLSSQIVVDSTETPGKNHTLQVFYAVGKKPIILAKKQILLVK